MRQKPGNLPAVSISRRGADRIRAGHVWVYRSDVVEANGILPGALVLVQEEATAASGSRADRSVRATRPLGTALYSTASEIAVRMISSRPAEDVHQLVRERIRAAIAYRQRFVRDTNAYRVIFSEGDFLPGLIVDRYNDVLSFQVLTQAMDSEAMREVFLSELKDAFNPVAIVERVDARVRKLERIPDKATGIVYRGIDPNAVASNVHGGTGALTRPGEQSSPDAALSAAGRGRAPAPTQDENTATPLTTEFQMNGVRFLFDALAGQKTGAFLDQRENYMAAAQYARGEALDVFCYHGGFALHLARVCDKVTAVDSSRPALEIAEKNAALNGREMEWIEANAFDLLRDYADQGKKYDCIVLDPPPFAKSRQNLATALRGYKELNLRALKMLRPGGLLVTCSCSYHVSATDFREIIASAGRDSHRIIRVLENRGQAKDHPYVIGIPETAYLKCLIVNVS